MPACGAGLLLVLDLLVLGQLALSLTLLMAAGLFVRGALKAGNINPGFRLDHGLLLQLDAGLAGYEEAQGQAVYRRVQERLASLPGVDSVSPAALGLLALFLAVVGVYGLKAYTVARRTREIGIRMALGATERATLWMFFKEGLWLTALGGGIGLALAILVGRLLSNLLYEVSPMDAVVFLSAPLLLTSISLLASFLPARRAAQIDPMVALRYE